MGQQACQDGPPQGFSHDRSVLRHGRQAGDYRPAEAGILLLIIVALVLFVGQPLQVHDLIVGILVTEWIIIALPVVLFVWAGGRRWRETLALRRAPARAFLGAMMAGSSAWYVVGAVVEPLQRRFLPPPPQALDALRRLLFHSQRSWLLDFVALALSPAICEELLFRGVLLQACSQGLHLGWAAAINAVLFGAFHLSIHRWLPTTLLGAVLALLVLQTGSIAPAMLFHLTNNAAALLAGRLGKASRAPEPFRPGWFMAGIVVSVLGLVLALGRHSDRLISIDRLTSRRALRAERGDRQDP